MLKALELVGFKSFADKTRFEFGKGITAVVGPNGSGKSNVVDGIKWVMGEQSAKSLRGKEMADCIFNGSGTRRSVNSAEVTLTFDNSSGFLPIDSPEVHITRRVYRSGEGEYLINRQPSRLRDIREMFMGTGAGSDAYSVIEQGKVDALLQASAKDRREIFEEAAGISRYRAKKLESLRRLERVDQNLLRMSDIVVEVENQLKSVRSQASRARRFQEYNNRLQELRTQVGLTDWRRLTEQLQTLEKELQQQREQIEQRLAEVDELETKSRQEDAELAKLDDAVRDCESRLAHHRQEIASAEATISHERTRCGDLDEEIARNRKQLAALSVRSGDLEHQLRETRAAVSEAEARQQEGQGELSTQEAELAALEQQIATQRRENEQRQADLRRELSRVSQLAGDIRSLESQVVSHREAAGRFEARLAELDQARRQLTGELDGLKHRETQLEQVVEEETASLNEVQTRLAEHRERRSSAQHELSQLSGRHSGTAERVALLEELEQRHEGLNPGVRQVLAEAKSDPQGVFAGVGGLVADLLQVDVETAPLIEAALGERAGYIVVENASWLFDQVAAGDLVFTGRVGFVGLETPASEPEVDLEGTRGVIGRADRLVETSPEARTLAARLLSHTWIVENLTVALKLARQHPAAGQFVTLAAEVVQPDATLVAGPGQTRLGLISRKSELRELKQQLGELDGRIATQQETLSKLEQQIDSNEAQLQTLTARRQKALDALSEHRAHVGSVAGRLGQLDEQRSSLQSEGTAASAAAEAAEAQVATANEQLSAAEVQVTELEAAIADTAAKIADDESLRSQQITQINAARVVLAKSEERLEALRASMFQLEREQEERQRTIGESRTQLAGNLSRYARAERNILECETLLAELYLAKESLQAETAAAAAVRDEQRSQRGKYAETAQKLRKQIRKLEESLHEQDLSANDIRHQRRTMAERLKEDYGIELEQMADEATAEQNEEREAIENEIEDLRRKLRNIGSVNVDALKELDDLEARFTHLSSQYEDLTSAKQSLEQIIEKINADSRRLFVETLETIRGHFQDLFRKCFGGGQGDIVLEEGVDILESGIDIVARPPGKELRNISLMSGGEKTMTCVAMLLAIFRSRPAPFCVLDEVDAALDEANIGRFIDVLREFATWTQFIVVTHSKKTMTCADALYGVTMQESGISKRVSVRFDDVSEDGHISQSAIDADEPPSPDDETQAA